MINPQSNQTRLILLDDNLRGIGSGAPPVGPRSLQPLVDFLRKQGDAGNWKPIFAWGLD